jgi:hypothetical protein
VIGYTLRGVGDDHILVFRTDDPEELLQVIERLKASRNKQMKALAEKLELDWYASQYKKEKRKN